MVALAADRTENDVAEEGCLPADSVAEQMTIREAGILGWEQRCGAMVADAVDRNEKDVAEVLVVDDHTATSDDQNRNDHLRFYRDLGLLANAPCPVSCSVYHHQSVSQSHDDHHGHDHRPRLVRVFFQSDRGFPLRDRYN